MYEYRFKNLNIKHEGIDFLVNGIAHYTIEDYEEDGKQALFEVADIYDALGKEGYVTSREVLSYMTGSVVETLNKDSYLCRILGGKIV